ncbi:hypothetical protein KBK19_05550 [Microvirga sp. STR05]|uniref:DUF5004 domain-containing protein n=1 Tax=Hymenobacter duratus TaxID=2771356 RepID=A0ABR8JFJ6_9BACT|nr:hypothetical protein [Hymenobacter duratus]MBD2714491.1 hypothetical protein [Hymenobacter duratus]MBR7949395.1 hypothetical protein [Microvirga sp. STR05]
MKFLAPLFFVLALSACKKKDPTIDFGPNGGIAMRDHNNYPMSTPDPTDWTLDGAWNTQERGLFQDLGLDLNATATGTVSNLSTYPNPVEAGRAIFHFTTPIAVTCSFVVVDEKYQVVRPLQTSTASSGLSFSLDVSDSAFQQGKLYRLYYVFRNGSSLYYKGHGDVKIGM